jgi:hypothetical protein
MLTRFRRHVRTNVVGYVALFFAMTAPAAAAVITGALIKDGSVTSADIRDESLRGADVQDESLTGADVLNDSLKGDDVDEASLGGLTGAQIQDGSLSGGDVRDDSLTGSDVDEATLSGVNAATLDGKEASEFASAADVDQMRAAFNPTVSMMRTNVQINPDGDSFDLRVTGTGLKPGTQIRAQFLTSNNGWSGEPEASDPRVASDGTIDAVVPGFVCHQTWRVTADGWFGDVISNVSAPGEVADC